MASIPMGMVHRAMFISQLDWDKNRTYNCLRWSSTYDSIILNYMISTKSKEEGNSFQLMLIFNH